MYIDPLYIYFAIPGLILSVLAQIYVKYTYNKYSKVPVNGFSNGIDIAKNIRDLEKYPVGIEVVPGTMSDHFDPRKNIVRISEQNAREASIAGAAIIAHEFGHVEQKFRSVWVYRVRQFLVPITKFGTSVGYVLFLVGLFLSILRLSEIGLLFFASSTVLAFVTLPLEFDASRRALQILRKNNIMGEYAVDDGKKVLNAAALTYVAGLVTSLLNLLYYASILSRRK